VLLAVPDKPSVGLAVEVVSGPPLGRSQLAIRADGHAFAVDGPLSSALTPKAWLDVASVDHFTVFRADTTPVSLWAEPVGASSPDTMPEVPATIHVVASGYDATTIEVRTSSPAVLTRSVAWDPGWHGRLVTGSTAVADLRSRSATSSLPGATPVTVHQVGLVQGVAVPAGLSVVEFSYEPPGFATGVALGAISVAAAAAGAVAVGLSQRRRRRLLRRQAAGGANSMRAEQAGADAVGTD
jgi:hypothetical protein